MTTKDLIKKYIPVGVLGVMVIIIVLCTYFPPFGTMICEMKSAPGDIDAQSTYTANFSLWHVDTLKITEIISSKDKEKLEEYKKSLEEDNNKFKKLNHFTNTISIEDETITNTTTIDYDKIDKKELKKIEKNFSNRMIRIGVLKKIYTKNGATCKYA